MTATSATLSGAPPAADWTVSPASVSVAIEGWNADDLESRAVFERSLDSLRGQTYPLADCEILVLLDAGDVEKLQDWIHSFLPEAKVVAVPGETYYRAKNLALQTAHGDFVVFADSDVAYEPDWLASMLACFRPGVDIVAGYTRFTPGFLSRTLDLCDWAATRPESGFTDWFYGNNVVMRRSLFETITFREDMGRSGGGSVNVLRYELLERGVRPWFCREARARHHLAPFLLKRIRIGAYHVRYRRLAPQAPWAWVAGVPLAGPFLATSGTMLAAWRRAWRLRGDLPGRGLSLPLYLASIALVKSAEALGAAAYAWAPGWLSRRYGWFDIPSRTSLDGQGMPEHA